MRPVEQWIWLPEEKYPNMIEVKMQPGIQRESTIPNGIWGNINHHFL